MQHWQKCSITGRKQMKNKEGIFEFLSNITVLKRIKIQIKGQHQKRHKHFFVSGPFDRIPTPPILTHL